MKRLILVFAVLAMVLCAACAPSGGGVNNAEHLPKYEELKSLIGLPKDLVLEKLSLEESDLIERNEFKGITPLTVEYGGVKLEIQLNFGPLEDVLNGFTYLAVYEQTPESAVGEMLSISKKVLALMGNPDGGNLKEPIWDMSEEEVNKAISEKKNLSKQYIWYLEEGVTDAMKTYMQELQKTDMYQGYQELNREPGFRCDFNLSAYAQNKEEAATAYLMISYYVSHVPSN